MGGLGNNLICRSIAALSVYSLHCSDVKNQIYFLPLQDFLPVKFVMSATDDRLTNAVLNC